MRSEHKKRSGEQGGAEAGFQMDQERSAIRGMALQVARWEFLRFFKPKDVVVTWLVLVAIALLYMGGKALLRMTEETATVAVLNAALLPFEAPPPSSFRIEPAQGRDEAELRRAVGSGELDGLLMLRSRDEAELLVSREPFWKDELASALGAVRRESRLREARLAPQALEEILAPFRIQVRYHQEATKPTSTSEVVFAAAFVGLMLWGVLQGNALLFVGITGEKQMRVTESVVAAISPQTWIDGKILGLSLLSLATLFSLSLGSLLANGLLGLLGEGFPLPLSLIDPLLLLRLAAMALLGFLFWLTFFAAVAATVDDPNSSSRSSLILLPLLPLGLAFAILKNPDSLLMKILGLLPPTSPTVLPGRLVLGQVSWWEFPLAVLLLAASIWLMRRAAGRIFALGILMYGKEPSWSEMRRQL